MIRIRSARSPSREGGAEETLRTTQGIKTTAVLQLFLHDLCAARSRLRAIPCCIFISLPFRVPRQGRSHPKRRIGGCPSITLGVKLGFHLFRLLRLPLQLYPLARLFLNLWIKRGSVHARASVNVFVPNSRFRFEKACGLGACTSFAEAHTSEFWSCTCSGL
jgi:hypothetical protein